MRGATKVFKVFGIDVKLHFSWWFVFVFLAWALSTGFFPQKFPDYSTTEYWFMGSMAALLLFVSVLMHELSHSLVARARHIKVRSITLFFFGGVSGIEDEDMKPLSEFLMSIAGPLFSLLLSAIFYLIFRININGLLTPIVYYLALVNLILAGFNLVPGFPLDGGRAFRAALYAYYKDIKKATKIAVSAGRFFAVFLIVFGIFGIISGSGGGLWFIFLGGFLYFIAGLSYEQVVLKETLSRIPLKELIVKKKATLKPEMKFSEFIKKYVGSDEEVFLVKDKSFIGVLDLKAISKMPHQMQGLVKIKQLAVPLEKIRGLTSKDNSYTAFRKFTEQKAELLPVRDGNKFAGLVTRRSIMRRLIWSLKYGIIDSSLKLTGKKSEKKSKASKGYEVKNKKLKNGMTRKGKIKKELRKKEIKRSNKKTKK